MSIGAKLGFWFITVLALSTISEGHVLAQRDTGRDCMLYPDYYNISLCLHNTTAVRILTSTLSARGGLPASTALNVIELFCHEFDKVTHCFEAETNVCKWKEYIMEEFREKQNLCHPQTRAWIHMYLAIQGTDLIEVRSCSGMVWQYLDRCNSNITRDISELELQLINLESSSIVQGIEAFKTLRDSIYDCLSMLNPVEDLEDPQCQRMTRGNILLFFAIVSAVLDPPGMALTILQLQNLQSLLPWG